MSDENFPEVRRCRTSHDEPDSVTCYLNMAGRVTLAELLDHLGNVAGSTPSHDITVNTGSIIWKDKASQDELDRWASVDAAQRDRNEEWQRKTYERLRAKYEGEDE